MGAAQNLGRRWDRAPSGPALAIVLLASILATSSCGGGSHGRQAAATPEDPDTVIGWFASPDVITRAYVTNLLDAAWIPVDVEGGLALQILVPARQANWARELLQGEPDLRPFVDFGKDAPGSSGPRPKEPDWKTEEGGPILEVRHRSRTSDAGRPTPIEQVLSHPDLEAEQRARGLTRIVQIRTRERRSYDRMHRYETAHEIDLDLADAGSHVTMTMRFAVFDGGVVQR